MEIAEDSLIESDFVQNLKNKFTCASQIAIAKYKNKKSMFEIL